MILPEFWASGTNVELHYYQEIVLFPRRTTGDGIARLVLKSNFFGELKNVQIFVDPVAVVETMTHKSMWSCDWSASYLPVATSTILEPNEIYKFEFDLKSYTKVEASVFSDFNEYINWLPIIRLRIVFYKKINGQSYSKDFYFVPYSTPNEKQFYLYKYPDFEAQAFYKNGNIVAKSAIVEMLQNVDFAGSDPRCNGALLHIRPMGEWLDNPMST